MNSNLLIRLFIIAASVTFTSAHAASFDCSKASTFVEREICGTPHLSNLDTELGAVFKRVTGASTSSVDPVRAAQRKWLKDVRNKCENAVCLMDAYESRILFWG